MCAYISLYPSDSAIHGDGLFYQNIFSVMQELSYNIKVNDRGEAM